jgi:hypothetical protein
MRPTEMRWRWPNALSGSGVGGRGGGHYRHASGLSAPSFALSLSALRDSHLHAPDRRKGLSRFHTAFTLAILSLSCNTGRVLAALMALRPGRRRRGLKAVAPSRALTRGRTLAVPPYCRRCEFLTSPVRARLANLSRVVKARSSRQDPTGQSRHRTHGARGRTRRASGGSHQVLRRRKRQCGS